MPLESICVVGADEDLVSRHAVLRRLTALEHLSLSRVRGFEDQWLADLACYPRLTSLQLRGYAPRVRPRSRAAAPR